MLVVIACVGLTAGGLASAAADDAVLQVSQGTVTFEVGTNIPALRVVGKSSAVKANARVRRGPEGAMVDQIEASLPVESLRTGLALRDEHMRKHIFTSADGQLPDVRFSAERSSCPALGSRQRITCEVIGTLVIREIARPLTIVLDLVDDDGALRAAGSGNVKLSAYGIERPSQLGVRTADDVKLRLEFTAERQPPQVAANAGGR
jgi:polyisoprenoid-binding protein YceI